MTRLTKFSLLSLIQVQVRLNPPRSRLLELLTSLGTQQLSPLLPPLRPRPIQKHLDPRKPTPPSNSTSYIAALVMLPCLLYIR